MPNSCLCFCLKWDPKSVIKSDLSPSDVVPLILVLTLTLKLKMGWECSKLLVFPLLQEPQILY